MSWTVRDRVVQTGPGAEISVSSSLEISFSSIVRDLITSSVKSPSKILHRELFTPSFGVII
jgi:hypothetical protein